MSGKLAFISIGLVFVLFGCSHAYLVIVEVQTTNNSGSSQVIGFTNSYTTIEPFTIEANETIPISLKFAKPTWSGKVTTAIQVFDDITSPDEIASDLFLSDGDIFTVLITILPGLNFEILD